jgi:membrane protein insertase Oxa1/YidC/SpoIIIJ
MINSLLLIYSSCFTTSVWPSFAHRIIRLITMPLTLRQQRSMEKMQEMQRSKKWQEIEKEAQRAIAPSCSRSR